MTIDLILWTLLNVAVDILCKMSTIKDIIIRKKSNESIDLYHSCHPYNFIKYEGGSMLILTY